MASPRTPANPRQAGLGIRSLPGGRALTLGAPLVLVTACAATSEHVVAARTLDCAPSAVTVIASRRPLYNHDVCGMPGLQVALGIATLGMVDLSRGCAETVPATRTYAGCGRTTTCSDGVGCNSRFHPARARGEFDTYEATAVTAKEDDLRRLSRLEQGPRLRSDGCADLAAISGVGSGTWTLAACGKALRCRVVRRTSYQCRPEAALGPVDAGT